MSDNTAPQGSESLNVEQAASAFFGLMDSEPNAEGQVEQNADSENDDGVDSELVDSEEGEKEQTSTFRVKAAGEERDVTLDQLIEGYQLGADYTKKTQTLSEQYMTRDNSIVDNIANQILTLLIPATGIQDIGDNDFQIFAKSRSSSRYLAVNDGQNYIARKILTINNTIIQK